jgi:hypothetical protein
MKIFEGKSPTERNKIIAALVLGALSLLAIGYNVIGFFPSSKKTVSVSVSPTPTPAGPNRTGDRVVGELPKQEEIDSIYCCVPVPAAYAPPAADAGRNIFAFFEPPIPTPYSPTPVPVKTPEVIVTPTPPIPNVLVSFISRQSVYAGEKGFRLEVGGDKSYVYFNGQQLPTNFVSPQQLSVDIPANFIAGEGQRQIVVQSPDGKRFSQPVMFNVQAPPRPQFQYIGIVSRKRGNNDTAYIQEQNKPVPTSARLNDVLGGRFRLVSIAPAKLMVQDVNLGFMHSVDLVKASGQTGMTGPSTIRPNPNFQDGNNYIVPNMQNPNMPNQQCPPGIPCNLPRYIPPTPQQPRDQKKDDDDDDDEDGDN